MNDPLKALIEAGAIDTSPFSPTSRYHGLPHGTHAQPGQDAVAYVKRRLSLCAFTKISQISLTRS